jgi:ketosteroid isomerase-like protein
VPYTREELEEAFAAYQDRAARAGRTGEWAEWAEQFTPDAVYVEHHYGRFEGRDAIRKWITACMSEFPGSAMPEFPVGWHVIDEERGWVICQVFNRMVDPGDGSIHEMDNLTVLHYAGDGQWSYEEDVYNPADFEAMVRGWLDRRRQIREA